MKRIGYLTWIIGLALAAACGGDSDSEDDGGGGSAGNGAVDTGVPESTPLEDVTPAQFASACEALRAEVTRRLGPDEAVRGACEVYSGTSTDVPSECNSAAAMCVPQANAGTHMLIRRDQLDFTSFECGDTGGLAGCNVTVGEFEICSNDRISAVEKVLADNDCSHAASVDFTTLIALSGIQNMSPPSCARLDSECPNVGLGQPQ